MPLGAVDAALGGNWSAHFGGGGSLLRTYPNGLDALVATQAYSDAYCLRVALVSTVPVYMYRQNVDTQAATNIRCVRADADAAATTVASLRAEVQGRVQRNWAVLAILLAGSLLMLLIVTRVGQVLLALAARMERVARLDI